MLLERLLKDLELTLEAFAVCEVASGWRLQLERADWVTVHFVLAGSGRLRMSGGPAVAMPVHTLALVPSNRRHAIEIGGPIEHEARNTDPHPVEDGLQVYGAGPRQADELLVACGRMQARHGSGLGLFDRLTEPLVLDFADSPQMIAIFDGLLSEERQRTAGSGAMMSTLMNQALILLFRRLCSGPECPLPWLSALEDPRLSAALTLMLEHPEHPHSVGSLADASQMSRSTFSEAFGERIGRSPMAYLREARLRRAAGLLRGSDLTIDQVATRVGYSSRSQFSRAFSTQFGVSPSAFRSAPFS